MPVSESDADGGRKLEVPRGQCYRRLATHVGPFDTEPRVASRIIWASRVNRDPFCQWQPAVEGEIMFGLVGIVVGKSYRLYVPGF